ncbi:MAG TPA: acyl carrier protein [Armatimonadota bacterium]|nr:acyl carrier protein [Armatimonadota bacterium]HOS42965.1 acyl carrier protein [Armatimonadota bacterium]
MASAETKREIKQMIVEQLFLPIAPEEIEDTAPLMDTYGVDSVALFSLIVGLEAVYGLTIEESEFRLALFQDVESIANFVESKTRGA